jgi:hypothetical protein
MLKIQKMTPITKGTVVLLLLLLPAFAQEKVPDNAEVAIRSLENEWTVGQSRNDNRALNLIFDNALVYVEYGKLVTKGEYLARIKQESPQIVMEAMTVRIFEKTAVVVGSYRERQVRGGQRTLIRWRFLDTWVLKKNGWVLVAAAASRFSTAR